jgi:hypothetical protein
MFGFGRKAKEKRKAKAIAAIKNATLDRLGDHLARVTYETAVAHGFREDEVQAKALMEKMGHIVMGFEAVRSGYDPDGPETISDPLAMGGAKVADAACYMATITGIFDSEYIAGNLRHLLGFSRDGSEIRQET